MLPTCPRCGTPYNLVPATSSWTWYPACGCNVPAACLIETADHTTPTKQPE